MNTRIKILREQSLTQTPYISAERAQLLTRFYQSTEGQPLSKPMQRALCFKYLLENKTICILKNELIVGERGPAPKAVPTYPEVTLHSIEDLQILNSREKVFYKVSDEVLNIYEKEIIPYWKGKSHRERMFEKMSDEWKNAYAAGIFTEFQEQRAPGHTVLGDKIYKMGMLDIIVQIEKKLEKISNETTTNDLKIQQLKAMQICAQALITFAHRHAEILETQAQQCTNTHRKNELINMAEICRHVPAHAPRTFHEALQYYWFVHLGVITELNPWDSFNPGRLDQHLLPFYQQEIEAGTLSQEQAEELLQAFWIKFNNHPAPPKVGITALESNTYTDFALINVGGLTPDGHDAVNELTYLILDVIEEMRLLQPSSMIQVSEKNPDAFIHRALQIVKTGFGQPSIFNTDGIINQLLRQGKNIVDARNGGASGCVETGAFGTECYFLTGYFNLTKILEITLHNGFDPISKKQIGLNTGDPLQFNTFDELLEAYKKQLNYFIEIKIQGNNIIESMFANDLPAPFLSLLIDDCIENAKDYNAGGARYNTSYIQGVGLGSITDNLTAIRHHVFDKKTLSLAELLHAISCNYQDFENMHELLINQTPKYGNDNDYADTQTQWVFDTFFQSVDGKPTYRGGTYRINLLPTTSHVYFGSKIGAMPDGRKALQPLSEGISPVQGADKNGPTAVLKSASKIPHVKTGGTLLNQKFTPDFFRGYESKEKLTALIRAYFKLGGHHIQFNVVSADTLRHAQQHPEMHKNLIVRVAGYSDYFNDLGEDLQNEIIARTEQYS